MAYIYDLVDSWNSAGTTFTAIKMNVTDTASSASSLLMDLQRNAVSQFTVRRDGYMTASSGLFGGSSGIGVGYVGTGIFTAPSGGRIEWGSSGVNNADLFLTRRGTANIRLGAADAAAPVAQTLSVQSVAAGTANTAGANFTITGSQGTGTGAGGSIIFQVAPATTNGSTPNALVNALTINDSGNGLFTGNIALGNSSGATLFKQAASNSIEAGYGFSMSLGGSTGVAMQAGAITLGPLAVLAFCNSNGQAVQDTILRRDDANILAQRNSTAAQTFRLYNTFTDVSNYERGFMRWSSNVLEIGMERAGTGTNRLLRFTSAIQNAWEFRSSGDPTPKLTIAGSDRSVTLYPQVNMLVAENGGFWSTLAYATGGSTAHALRHTTADQATTYFGVIGSAAGVMQVNNGSGRGSGYGASVEMFEMTAPAAPPTNGVRIYAEDNGSGKTRLMAQFATGAPVQIAIEP